jgi:hypothetical protein
MFQAALSKEIVVKTENDVGVLWDISRTVAERGVDVLAIAAWVEDKQGIVRLVTDDNLRAREALERKGYTVKEETAVAVELLHKPGLLKHMTEPLMGEALDISHLYGSALGSQDKCLLVFSCQNNERAVVLLNKTATAQKVPG